MVGLVVSDKLLARGHEVDFLATQTDGRTQLIQVAADIENESTLQRELRSLEGASEEFRLARKILLAEEIPPRGVSLPEGVEVIPVWQWLLFPDSLSDGSACASDKTGLRGVFAIHEFEARGPKGPADKRPPCVRYSPVLAGFPRLLAR